MSETARNIAIIGAGPAAIYGAGKLAGAGHHVVIFNRDIKPGGLAEYGIYPNKYRMKNGLRKMFGRILSDPRIRYMGNVTVGEGADLTLEEVWGLGFDAVVVAVGAQGTKWLGLPGEQAEAVYHAKDLVYHYNHLPPFSQQEFQIGQDVVVVGFGNVALDIVHWLINDKQIRAVTVVARRGPDERACTKKELKIVSGAIDTEQLRQEFEAIRPALEALDQDVEAIYDDLTRFIDRPLECPSPTKFRMRFLRSPARIETGGDGQVTALVCEHTRLTPPRAEGGRPGVERIGEFEPIPCDTVVFAIGDSIEPSIGLPLEPEWGSTFAVVPEPWEQAPEAPRYMVWDPEAEEPMWGTFVVGWARKASDGLVGKARADAETGCDEILAYLAGQLGPGPDEEPADPEALLERAHELLQGRQVQWVDLQDVAQIEDIEEQEAQAREVPEFKFRSNEAMLELVEAHGAE